MTSVIITGPLDESRSEAADFSLDTAGIVVAHEDWLPVRAYGSHTQDRVRHELLVVLRTWMRRAQSGRSRDWR